MVASSSTASSLWQRFVIRTSSETPPLCSTSCRNGSSGRRSETPTGEIHSEDRSHQRQADLRIRGEFLENGGGSLEDVLRLEKGAARLGAGIVASYVVSQGSLPSIQVNGATPATDIALGTLTIDDDTTVAEFAQAVVQNNYAYSYGDQIAFFRLVQEEDSQDGHPYISVSATRVNLDPTDTSTLRSVAPASGFSTVSGMLGADAALTGAGIAWVHSRTTNGKTHVSSQRLVVENDLLEEYGTTQMLSVATKSYGGTTEIFIRPDGSSGGVIVDGNEDGGSSPSEPGSGDEDSFG